MNTLRIGDKVEVLDEAIKGFVIGLKDAMVQIETEDGFEMEYEPSQLVKIEGKIDVSNYDIAKIKKEKHQAKERKKVRIKSKDRNAPKMEVDLHIHQLTNTTRGMNNFDMLNLQLETAKRQLEFAMRKRIQKVVFIHGVGEGVLKEELKYLFNRYDNVSFYDAEYKKYGLGATEVYIYQNTN